MILLGMRTPRWCPLRRHSHKGPPEIQLRHLILLQLPCTVSKVTQNSAQEHGAPLMSLGEAGFCLMGCDSGIKTGVGDAWRPVVDAFLML